MLNFLLRQARFGTDLMRAKFGFSPKSAPAPATYLLLVLGIACGPFITTEKNIGKDAINPTVTEFDKHDDGAANHTRLHLENSVRNKVNGKYVGTVGLRVVREGRR